MSDLPPVFEMSRKSWITTFFLTDLTMSYRARQEMDAPVKASISTPVLSLVLTVHVMTAYSWSSNVMSISILVRLI